MRKRKNLLPVFLIASVFFLGLECTCFSAVSMGPVQKAEASVPDCHAQGEPAGTQESQDCCGKCQADDSAVIKASSQDSAAPAFKSHFFALRPELIASAGIENGGLYLQTPPPVHESLHFFTARPRAPPAL